MGNSRYDGYIAAAQDNEAGYGGNTSVEIAVKAGEILGFLRSVNGSYPPYSDDHTSASVIACRKDHSNNNLAHIIKPAVCMLKDIKASDAEGGTNVVSGTSWQDRQLNTIEGESWFVESLASNVFTLQAGTYELDAYLPFYRTDLSVARLYDVTNSVVASYGSHTFSDYGSDDFTLVRAHISHTFTITASTQFKFQYRSATSKTNDGLGYGPLGYGSYAVFTQCKIRKLK
jgi:hypothetical protein